MKSRFLWVKTISLWFNQQFCWFNPHLSWWNQFFIHAKMLATFKKCFWFVTTCWFNPHKLVAKNSHIFVRHGAPFCGQEMEIEELKEKLSSGIPREMAVLEERLEATGTGRRMSWGFWAFFSKYDQDFFFLGNPQAHNLCLGAFKLLQFEKKPVDANARSISRTSLWLASQGGLFLFSEGFANGRWLTRYLWYLRLGVPNVTSEASRQEAVEADLEAERLMQKTEDFRELIPVYTEQRRVRPLVSANDGKRKEWKLWVLLFVDIVSRRIFLKSLLFLSFFVSIASYFYQWYHHYYYLVFLIIFLLLFLNSEFLRAISS